MLRSYHRPVSIKDWLLALALFGSILLVQSAPAQVRQDPTFILGPGLEDPQPGPGEPPLRLLFGFAVAIHRDTALVSMPAADPPRVAVFTRNESGEWLRTATLLNELGSSLAIRGDYALIASGLDLNAYRRTAQGWVRTQVINVGASVTSLVMDGKVAAYVTTPPAQPSSVRVLYRNQRGRWLQGPTLMPADGGAWGSSLALSKHTLVVGASLQDDQRGAAYIFRRTGVDWREVQKLLAPEDDTRRFGETVAVNGDRIAIGAPFSLPINEFSGSRTGAAYIYGRHGRSWHQIQRLKPMPGDLFGSFVALTRSMLTVISSAPTRFDQPEMFVYEPSGPRRTYEAKTVVVLDMFSGITDHAASGDTALIGVPFDSPFNTGYVAGYENSPTQ